jgi:hypothetical protein
MTDFNHKERSIWKGRHLLGTLFVFAGIFAISSPYLFQVEIAIIKVFAVGGTMILLGCIFISIYQGITISFRENRIRKYESFLGFKIGEWEKMPNILEIRLSSSTYSATNTPNGISPTISGKATEYVVHLNDDNRTFLKIIFDKEKNALTAAKRLSQGFGVELKNQSP